MSNDDFAAFNRLAISAGISLATGSRFGHCHRRGACSRTAASAGLSNPPCRGFHCGFLHSHGDLLSQKFRRPEHVAAFFEEFRGSGRLASDSGYWRGAI